MPTYSKGDPDFEKYVYAFLHGDLQDQLNRALSKMVPCTATRDIHAGEPISFGGDIVEEGEYVPPKGTVIIDAVAHDVGEPDKRIVVVGGGRDG